jgi:MFS family permease
VRGSPVRLGLRANAAQFALLVAVNALVGGMLGQERTVLPLLAEQEFGLGAYTAALTYILAFGLAKAATNYLAGTWSDRYGRKPVLVAGWLIAVPVPLVLIWAPSWAWVVAANLLLGVSQGLTWSTTVIMKIDLVGPARRGLAMGLNEAAGYGAVAATALATGYLAAEHGLRPEPFYLGVAYAALGLGLSGLAIRETRGHVDVEAASRPAATEPLPGGTDRPRRVRHDHPARAGAVGGQPGRPGQQPQRRAGLGVVPRAVRRLRTLPGSDRGAGRPVPRGVGARAARHRRGLGPGRPEAAHRLRHGDPGGCPWHRRAR